MRTTLIVVLTVLLFGTTMISPASSADKKSAATTTNASKKAPRLSMRVFYVTSRKWDGKSFTSERGNGASHEIGMVDYTFDRKGTRNDMLAFASEESPSSWRIASEKDKDGLGPLYKSGTFKDFLRDLEVASEMSKKREIVVWVHGYFNSFNDSIEGAAELESYFKCPVIAYSWPSVKTGKLPSKGTYREAVGNAEWNQESFTSFLRILNSRFPRRVTVVCHSMGSRLVTGALRDLVEGGQSQTSFPEVVFCSPDFDSHTFVNRYSNAISAADKVRIYINPSDMALGTSEDMWGGHSRLGRPGDDVGMLLNLSNVEIIDFHDYGGGLIGHGVPVAIVSSVHYFSRPQRGWSLQQQAKKLVRESNN